MTRVGSLMEKIGICNIILSLDGHSIIASDQNKVINRLLWIGFEPKNIKCQRKISEIFENIRYGEMMHLEFTRKVTRKNVVYGTFPRLAKPSITIIPTRSHSTAINTAEPGLAHGDDDDDDASESVPSLLQCWTFERQSRSLVIIDNSFHIYTVQFRHLWTSHHHLHTLLQRHWLASVIRRLTVLYDANPRWLVAHTFALTLFTPTIESPVSLTINHVSLYISSRPCPRGMYCNSRTVCRGSCVSVQ